MATPEVLIVAAGGVRHLQDGEPDDGAGRVTLSGGRFSGAPSSARVGLRIGPADSLDDLGDEIARAPFIAIEFPKFADGRGYSLARLLRQRFEYSHPIWAIGQVLRDQASYLVRCGFDVLEIAQGSDEVGFRQALREFSVVYQAAADGKPPVYLRDEEAGDARSAV